MAESEEDKASAEASSMTTTIVSAIAIVLAVVATALRFYTRIHKRSGLWWDDWFLIISWVSWTIDGSILD